MCAFQVSPGVQVVEKDLTNIIPAVATSIGGMVGYFNWGPVEDLTLISSEKDLVNLFGKPDSFTAESFFIASSFLKYGNALKVLRATNTALKNAVDSGTAPLIKNSDAWEIFGTKSSFDWIAKYPGALGNSLDVVVYDPTEFASPTTGDTDFTSLFDSAPDSDEVHIVVVDRGGAITGTEDTVLETFEYVSTVSGTKKADGSTNYLPEVIERYSSYIYLGTASEDSNGNVVPTAGTYVLASGVDASTITEGDITAGLDLLNNSETVDINLLFTIADADASDVLAEKVIEVAEDRKDIVGFVSPPTEDTVNIATATAVTNVVGFANGLTSSSYVVIDSTALYVYDKYNDVYRWIPACGHVAGLCANTDDVADPWYSPAGFNRGNLRSVVKLALTPNKTYRDSLYKAKVNPIVTFPGEGIVLYGDKTGLSKPSAFDRINVRRLFIVLEKAISTAAKYQLFEFNDAFTQAQFRNMVEPFLREVQGRRGITDFYVVCDETNNTGDVVDRNEFVADIYIKPARSINYITLYFIATRTDVAFSEIIGQNV